MSAKNLGRVFERRRLIEFEGIGALYERRFHRLRPGKDDKLRDSMDDDNVRQFSDWIKHEALTDAIFEIDAAQRILAALLKSIPESAQCNGPQHCACAQCKAAGYLLERGL